MLKRLATLLKVRLDEGRLVILVALLFACIQAGQGMGDNAASALFLLRFGVDYLPYLYIAAGALTFVVTMAYSAGLGRFEKGRFFLWVLAAFAALLILERVALTLSVPFLYPVLWLTVNGMAGILGTFIWNLAGDVCDTRQAKRLFPLFTSAGILGSVLGNAVTGLIAKRFGTENLFLFYAFLLGIAFYLTRLIALAYLRREKTFGHQASLMDDLRSGFDFVRGSPLMRLISYSSILFSVLFFTIAFPFNKVVTTSFSDEAGVAGFFGLFNSITTAATFFISLFLANRVYTRLGIINSVFLMPLAYLFSFTVFNLRYDLSGATIARFAQLVILAGIAGTAWNALFNVVPSQKRGQVLAFNNGVPSQIGVILSGVLLIVADRVFTVQQIFLIGASVALVCGVFVWRMRAAYARALVDALRAGRLEVFSANEAAFGGLKADAAALSVAIQSLQDPKASTRRLAADILGRMQAASAIPDLVRTLSDQSADVRTSAIAALGALGATSHLNELIAHLDDPEDQVRQKLLSILPQVEVQVSPALLERLNDRLNHDPSREVQMQAAVALLRFGHSELAMPRLLTWLNSTDPQLRTAALIKIREAAPYLTIPFDWQPLLHALDDPSAPIRRAAALALSRIGDITVTRELIKHLTDPDETVRAASAEALRQRGDDGRMLVLEIFKSDHPAIDSALDALAPGKPQSLDPLRPYIQREISHARTFRNQLASLPSGGRYVRFLRDHLQSHAAKCEARLIKTIGLFGDSKTMELVRKGMNGSNAGNRAAALEALDTIGDRQFARSIVALLEEEPQPLDLSDMVAVLLKNTDPWLRILAVGSTAELNLHEFIPLLHQMKSGPNMLLGEAAASALSQLCEEIPMSTLKTVSILERILLLREIPIFADLSPEDLKDMAEMAHEEWYPQNTDIFHQGEEGSRMFVIVDGRLQVVRNRDGTDQVLAERGPGDFVGEMAIIESAPRYATLHTQSEVRVLAIDDETFKGILRERPDVALAVLRSLSRRLREMVV